MDGSVGGLLCFGISERDHKHQLQSYQVHHIGALFTNTPPLPLMTKVEGLMRWLPGSDRFLTDQHK
jgi:hypothetical protein